MFTSLHMTKLTKRHVRRAKTPISLDIPQSDQTALCAQWATKDPRFLHVDREDWSDWADALVDPSFLGAQIILLVLSCTGSYYCIAINIKWFKMGDKSRITSVQISLGRLFISAHWLRCLRMLPLYDVALDDIEHWWRCAKNYHPIVHNLTPNIIKSVFKGYNRRKGRHTEIGEYCPSFGISKLASWRPSISQLWTIFTSISAITLYYCRQVIP